MNLENNLQNDQAVNKNYKTFFKFLSTAAENVTSNNVKGNEIMNFSTSEEISNAANYAAIEIKKCYKLSAENDLKHSNRCGGYGCMYNVVEKSYLLNHFKEEDIVIKVFYASTFTNVAVIDEAEGLTKNLLDLKELCMKIQQNKEKMRGTITNDSNLIRICNQDLPIEYMTINNASINDYFNEISNQISLLMRTCWLIKILNKNVIHISKEDVEKGILDPTVALKNIKILSKVAEKLFKWNIFLGCGIVFDKINQIISLSLIMRKYDDDAGIPKKRLFQDMNYLVENTQSQTVERKYFGLYTDFNVSKKLISCLLTSTHYLFKVGIEHDDIKLDNFLYKKEPKYSFVLTDWGILSYIISTSLHEEKIMLEKILEKGTIYVDNMLFTNALRRDSFGRSLHFGEVMIYSLLPYLLHFQSFPTKSLCEGSIERKTHFSKYLSEVCINPMNGGTVHRFFHYQTPIIYSIFTLRLLSFFTYLSPEVTYVHNMVDAYEIMHYFINKKKIKENIRNTQKLNTFLGYSFTALIKNRDLFIEKKNWEKLILELLNIANYNILTEKIRKIFNQKRVRPLVNDAKERKLLINLSTSDVIKIVLKKLHKEFFSLMPKNKGPNNYISEFFGLSVEGYVHVVFDKIAEVLNEDLNLIIAKKIADENKTNIENHLYEQFVEYWDVDELYELTFKFINDNNMTLSEEKLSTITNTELRKNIANYYFAYIAGRLEVCKNAWNFLNNIILYAAVSVKKEHFGTTINKNYQADFYTIFFEVFNKEFFINYGTSDYWKMNAKTLYGRDVSALLSYIKEYSWNIATTTNMNKISQNEVNLTMTIERAAAALRRTLHDASHIRDLLENDLFTKIYILMKNIDKNLATFSQYRTLAMFNLNLLQYIQRIMQRVTLYFEHKS